MCCCAFKYLKAWSSLYESMLGRKVFPSDPVFPRANETVTELQFGEKMVQEKYVKTINRAVPTSKMIPLNASGE